MNIPINPGVVFTDYDNKHRYKYFWNNSFSLIPEEVNGHDLGNAFFFLAFLIPFLWFKPQSNQTPTPKVRHGLPDDLRNQEMDLLWILTQHQLGFWKPPTCSTPIPCFEAPAFVLRVIRKPPTNSRHTKQIIGRLPRLLTPKYSDTVFVMFVAFAASWYQYSYLRGLNFRISSHLRSLKGILERQYA